MNQVIKTSVITIFFIFISCKKECNLLPIEKVVLDVSQIKGDYILENQYKEKDTLKLIEYSNDIIKEEMKTPTIYQSCEHTIFYRYSFREETVGFTLIKSEYNYVFNGYSAGCIDKNIVFNLSQIKDVNLIDVNFKKDKSKFKTVMLKKFIIYEISTQEGNVWKPIKFITR